MAYLLTLEKGLPSPRPKVRWKESNPTERFRIDAHALSTAESIDHLVESLISCMGYIVRRLIVYVCRCVLLARRVHTCAWRSQSTLLANDNHLKRYTLKAERSASKRVPFNVGGVGLYVQMLEREEDRLRATIVRSVAG